MPPTQDDRDRLAHRIKASRELLAEIPDDQEVSYSAYFGRLEVALASLADAAEAVAGTPEGDGK